MICDECIVVFQVFVNATAKRKFYCPVCGDDADVHHYVAQRSNETRKIIPWTKEEEAYLPLIRDRELSVTQVAIKIGRPQNSISKKYARWLNEQGGVNNGD